MLQKWKTSVKSERDKAAELEESAPLFSTGSKLRNKTARAFYNILKLSKLGALEECNQPEQKDQKAAKLAREIERRLLKEYGQPLNNGLSKPSQNKKPPSFTSLMNCNQKAMKAKEEILYTTHMTTHVYSMKARKLYQTMKVRKDLIQPLRDETLTVTDLFTDTLR